MNSNDGKILNFFNDSDWLNKQNKMAKKMRISNARFGLIISLVVILIAVAALLYWRYGGSKKALLFLILGIILVIVSFFHAYKNLIRIFNASKINYYTSLDRLCKDFYSIIFTTGEDTQGMIVDYLPQCIPTPICESYSLVSKDYMSWTSLVKRWRMVKKWDADKMITLKVDQLPRADPNITDVCVHLNWFIGKEKHEILFSNIAFHVSDIWFLATPEPIIHK